MAKKDRRGGVALPWSSGHQRVFQSKIITRRWSGSAECKLTRGDFKTRENAVSRRSYQLILEKMQSRRLCRTNIANSWAIRHNNRADSKLVVSSLGRILPALGRQVVNTGVTSPLKFQSNKNCTGDQGGAILGLVVNKQMPLSVLPWVCFADSSPLVTCSFPSLLSFLPLSWSLTVIFWSRTLMSKKMRGQEVHWKISPVCGDKQARNLGSRKYSRDL